MLKSPRILATVVLAIAGLAAATSAKADNVDNVNLTFASGATFSGTVDFANDYSYITGVNGTLYGYQSGITGYQGSGSDVIDWVWATTNQSGVATPNVFGTWLMDGISPTWSNFIGFSYDYTNAPTLVIDNFVPTTDNIGNTAWNAINYTDALTGGSINFAYSTNATPEPSSFLLLGSGLVGLAGMVRRKLGMRG